MVEIDTGLNPVKNPLERIPIHRVGGSFWTFDTRWIFNSWTGFIDSWIEPREYSIILFYSR